MSVTPWIITIVVIALCASGGYWFFQEHQMVREALADAEAEVERAKRHAAQADSQVMTVEAELSRVRGDFSADRQKLRKTRDALAAVLGPVIEEGRGAAMADAGDGLRVQVDSSALFAGNRSALSSEGRLLMQNVAAVLTRFPDVDIWVRSDAEPGAGNATAEGWQRSSARALAVSQFLEQESVEPTRLAVVTRAAGADPTADTSWRVEIVIANERLTRL